MSGNGGGQEFANQSRAPHVALVNSIKKLSRDRITPTASQKITLSVEESIDKEQMLQKFKLESLNSKM